MPDLKEYLRKEKWFHALDFGEFASSGRFRPGQPQNITLYGFMDLIQHIDLRGASVLDIGATDGLASFGMKKLGAATVHATDSVDRATFRFARDHFGLDIEYYPNTQIKDLAKLFGASKFDLILCAGVFYHMLNPASALIECRKLLKNRGLFVLETAYNPKEKKPVIYINSEAELVDEVNTYSIPSESAIIGLFKLFGMEVLAIRTLKKPDRITVLGRAVEPEQVPGRSDLLQRIHRKDFCDYEFRLSDHVSSAVTSTIEYVGVQSKERIHYKSYQPNFPFHPPASKPHLGQTIWTSSEGNK